MTDSSLLLFDAGNTRLKWAIKRDDKLSDHGAWFYTDDLQNDLPAELTRAIASGPSHALIGSVASQVTLNTLQAWLASNNIVAFEATVKPLDRLQLAYQDYETLGVDRWLAMLGAQTLYPGAVCVADCGTALTLDSVDERGRHLGGMIVPGFELMQRALLTQTARIGSADQPLPESPFGDRTGAAVNAGATYSLAAVLDRFVEEAAQALSVTPVVLVTGGGRERLLRFTRTDAIEVPDLVLLGLATLRYLQSLA